MRIKSLNISEDKIMRKLYTILVAVLLTATTLNAKTAESITGTISEIDLFTQEVRQLILLF